MNQETIDAQERLQKMETISKRMEDLLPRMEAALAGTPAEVNSALEKKVEEIDKNCADAIAEIGEKFANQNDFNLSIAGRFANLEKSAEASLSKPQEATPGTSHTEA